MTFDELDIPAPLRLAISARGYQSATPVQEAGLATARKPTMRAPATTVVASVRRAWRSQNLGLCAPRRPLFRLNHFGIFASPDAEHDGMDLLR